MMNKTQEAFIFICFHCQSSKKSSIVDCICPQCQQQMVSFDHPDQLTTIHADMDAFFASVEILDHPDLKGKPVIVGGNPKSRGVVSTCSYEARQYGVHSAMPSYKAYQLCPHGIFIEPNYQRYQEISNKIFHIYQSFTPIFETLSLDEAFLDMRGTENLWGHPILAACQIKDSVYQETGLTVSIGVAPNKFLAKLASDEKKPDGLYVMTPNQKQQYLDLLPIEKMWGLGKKTYPFLKEHGFYFIQDIRQSNEDKLKKYFGSQWKHFLNLSQGIDDRKIEPEHESKSCGKEHTYATDHVDEKKIIQQLWNISENLSRTLYQSNLRGKTIQLKLKNHRFQTITRSQTLDHDVWTQQDIYQVAQELFLNHVEKPYRFRLIGISVSSLNLRNTDIQLDFFNQTNQKIKINQVVNTIKDKLGENSITHGKSLLKN